MLPVPTAFEREVLALLIDHTVQDVADRMGVSRWRVWKIQTAYKALKHQARRDARAADKAIALADPEIINQTLKADVLEFLAEMPSDVVSLHLTSPPYNLGKIYGSDPASDRRPSLFYEGWMMMVISEMARTLKPNGVLCLQVGTTLLDDGSRRPLDIIFDGHLRAAGLTFWNRIILPKAHGLIPKGTKDGRGARFADRHETMLIFVKGDRPQFNVHAVRTPHVCPAKRNQAGEISSHIFGSWPSDVWLVPQVKHNHPEQTGHPAQFAELLARRSILTFTNPLDLVCDVFSGSGTTQAVARRTSRTFVGCDLFYETLRNKRLATIQPDILSVYPGVTAESLAIWDAEARRRDVGALPTTSEQEQQLLFDTFADLGTPALRAS